MIYSLVGWTTSICFTLAYLPQLWKTYKTKSVEDLSLITLMLSNIAGLLGIIYTYHSNQFILQVGYTLGVWCSLLLTVMYLRYKK